jgi:hypothetical protein
VDRADFQELTRIRIAEARALLQLKHACGAYYLSGLSVECAIKACIARNMRRHEFPTKGHEQRCYVHDLTALLRVANLEDKLLSDCQHDATLGVNWNCVRDWNVEQRYESAITIKEARDLYAAVVSRTHGVLRWLRQNW